MLIQQIVAFLLLAIMIWRVILRWRKKEISNKEFLGWLLFWLVIGMAVLFLKYIDQWVEQLGFSASGIEVLLYLAVAFLFYLIFRIYVRLDKMESDVTKIVREIALTTEKHKNIKTEKLKN